MGVKDTVAVGAYNFGVQAEEDTDGDVGAVNPERIVPDEGEDDVAKLFASGDEEQGDVASDHNEPNHQDSELTPSEDPSDDDPEKLNLIEDIAKLEEVLSVERNETNRRIVMMLATGADITEVSSPPRIAEAAKEVALIPGDSMDLLTGWDFRKSADRRRAIDNIKTQRPFVIVGSPPCTLFSILQFSTSTSSDRNGRQTLKRGRRVPFATSIFAQLYTGCSPPQGDIGSMNIQKAHHLGVGRPW